MMTPRIVVMMLVTINAMNVEDSLGHRAIATGSPLSTARGAIFHDNGKVDEVSVGEVSSKGDDV